LGNYHEKTQWNDKLILPIEGLFDLRWLINLFSRFGVVC
jgi:hypothetical protein